jgi:hypothetical protein
VELMRSVSKKSKSCPVGDTRLIASNGVLSKNAINIQEDRRRRDGGRTP